MPKRSAAANSPFVRRSFTRYRFGGVAAEAIPRAWLRILGPSGGAPQILDPIAQQNRTLAAFIRIQNVYGVRVADILKESATGRIFVVGQVQPEPGKTDLLHCSEIRAPIPDEFNAQSVEAFWSQTGTGFQVSSDGPSEPVLLLSSMPAGGLPSAAKGNYQLVSGDFDVWTKLKTDVGSVGNVRYALVGARHPASGLGCYVGVRDDGQVGELVRLDEWQAATLKVTSGVIASSATLYYARLRRSGGRFQVFFKTTPNAPIADTDWIEIFNDPAQSFASTDDLRVGLFAFTNNSTLGQALWTFLRNWAGSGSPLQEPLGSLAAWSMSWGYDAIPPAVESVESVPRFIVPVGAEIKLTDLTVVWAKGTVSGGVNTWTIKRRNSSGAILSDIGAVTINGNPKDQVIVFDVDDVILSAGNQLYPLLTTRGGAASEGGITISARGTQRLT